MQEKINIASNIGIGEETLIRSATTGILLIHGLTGTPTEMKPLAKYLKKLGYRVESPTLAGHAGGHEELLATTWQDWLDSVRQVLNTLTAECDEVIIVGLSVGGLLGVLLAAENTRVNGLVLLSFALGIPGPNTPPNRCLLPLVFKFPFLRRYLFWKEEPPYGLKDSRLQQNITRTIEASRRGETNKYGLFRTYVESLYQHKLLEKEVCIKASQVSCPTFIMHSFEDTMLSVNNATKIYHLLGSKEKSIELITGCDHVMTVDLKKFEVAEKVGNFISKITEGPDSKLNIDSDDLVCEVHPRLNPISKSDWEQVFSKLPDSYEMINLMQRSGFDGFNFHSIIVKYRKKPILVLPLFETNYNISVMINKNSRKLFNSLADWMPALLRPRVLGVGFVEGEWGQIGFDSSVDMTILDQAWELAMKAFDGLVYGLKADITSFTNFNAENKKTILMNRLEGFTELAGLPYAQQKLTYQDLEDYIKDFHLSIKKDLNNKSYNSSDVKITRTLNIKPYLEVVYQLYLKATEKNKIIFGVHRPSYFEYVCEVVPNAEYVLYFINEKLIAFNLVTIGPDFLVNKYFCMDQTLGPKYNLHLLSWFENVQYCIKNKISLYSIGQAGNHTRENSEVEFLQSLILFKHCNPLIHFLLTRFKNHLVMGA